MEECSGKAILFEGDSISEVLEIQNELILIKQNQFLLMMHDWKVSYKFNMYNQTDAYNVYFQALPGFSMEDLPIIVAKSKKEICMFNAK